MSDPTVDKAEFKSRFLSQYIDPAFDKLAGELDRIAEAAWDGYDKRRKAPCRVKAGPGYADPDYELGEDWVEAKAAVNRAKADYDSGDRLQRVLLVNASPRTEHTCPGEMSKSFRLVSMAAEVLEEAGIETEVLDLSRTTAEYGRNINPCKGCFSTAAPLALTIRR
jgi:hypothetical protein